MKQISTKYLIQASVIAAIYTALTLFFIPISYGLMQVRISEALTILPMFTPAAVPGLFVGCFLSNLIGPNGAMDIVIGSGATLIAAVCSYRLRKKPKLVPLPPVIANAVLVGWELSYVYGLGIFPVCMAWVGLGELIACYGLGFPLMRLLKKYESIFQM